MLSLLFLSFLPLALSQSSSPSSPPDPARVFIHPSPLQTPLTVSPPEAHAILSHHLGVARYDYPPVLSKDAKWGWEQALGLGDMDDIDRIMRGGHDVEKSRTVVIVLEDDDLTFLPSALTHPTLLITTPPSSPSFDALITTYMHRLSSSLGLSRENVLGIETFVHERLFSILGLVENVGNTLGSWLGRDRVRTMQVEEPERGRWVGEMDGLDESFNTLLAEIKILDDVHESLNSPDAQGPQVAALSIKGLREVAAVHGVDSSSYTTARLLFTRIFTPFLTSLTNTNTDTNTNTKLILIALPSSSSRTNLNQNKKRGATSPLSPFLSPAPPSLRRRQATALAGQGKPLIPSSQKCFESQDTCNNSTSSCAGNGQCVESHSAGGLSQAKGCWTCACDKRKGYGGDMCQKKDISSQFFLLAGTTIILLVVAWGSAAMLYSEGERELPAVLVATATGLRKTD